MANGVYLGAGTGTTKGLYHLDGNANDSSGNGNNGTSTNVSYVAGRLGSQCASFNGSTSGIQLTNNCGWTSTSNFTGVSWFKITANPTLNTSPIIAAVGEATNSTNFSTAGVGNNSGTFLIFGGKSRNNTQGEIVYNINLNDGNWHNIISTSNGGGTQILYLDGKQVATGDRTGNGTGGQNDGRIGRWQVASQFFNGLVDEVFFENRVWSEVEVKKYYTYSKGRFGIIS